MAKIIFLFVISFSVTAKAFDLEKFKERLRPKIESLLGSETAEMLLGKEKSAVLLPEIPQVTADATSTSVYEANHEELEKQSAAFDNLPTQEKRRYRVAFIQELYRVTRNSEPKEGDVLKFLNVLEQGGSREGVYRAITLDSLYSTLESYEETPEDGLENFAVSFGEKYLARRFDKSAMGQMNLWTIKRILVEKTLDVMDALAAKPEDLRSWYAVLSAQLAKDFQMIWKNDVRRNTSAEFHKRWAAAAPFQHIKSETIIKLHEVMNHLNNVQQ